jgi:hypothetical protein
MTQAGKQLARDVTNYLAAVDVFRHEGSEPVYRTEALEAFERPQMPRREIRRNNPRFVTERER